MQAHGFGGELQQKPERSSRSSRSLGSTFGRLRWAGAWGRSRARLPGPAGRARACLAVVWLVLAPQGNQAEGGPQLHHLRRRAEGHPLICAPSSRRLPSVRFGDGKGERGAALGQTAVEAAYGGPCLAADGRRPSPAAGFHVPLLASGPPALGGTLGPCPVPSREERGLTLSLLRFTRCTS
jgi:hypothetical protein